MARDGESTLRVRDLPATTRDREAAHLIIEVTASNQGRIEATDTTRWFGFKDDVVIRIKAENGQTRLDVRSKSRVGRSDVGTNAKRIRQFREVLAAKLAGEA